MHASIHPSMHARKRTHTHTYIPVHIRGETIKFFSFEKKIVNRLYTLGNELQ